MAATTVTGPHIVYLVDADATGYAGLSVNTTNASIILRPNGTGSVLAQAPDGTAAGGIARGTNAVDLQTVRSFGSQVASGVESVVVGGRGCRADGFRAVAAGGFGAAAFANNSYAAGNSVTANGNDSYCVGTLNLASGVGSGTFGGRENIASAQYSATIGGYQAVADHYSELAQAAGNFTADGDAQYSRVIMRNRVVGDTPTELYLDGSSTQFVLPNNTAYSFTVEIVAKVESTTVDVAVWHIDGGVYRGASAGATGLIGATSKTKKSYHPGSGTSNTWTITTGVDTGTGALTFTFAGAVGLNHRVVATVHLTKVTAS